MLTVEFNGFLGEIQVTNTRSCLWWIFQEKDPEL